MPSLEEARELLAELSVPSRDALLKAIEYFEREAEDRDAIVSEYLGERDVENVVEELAIEVRGPLVALEVGAGSGSFAARFRSRVRYAEVYGLDSSPKMLERLAEKGITPIWGAAEDIGGSIRLAARRGVELPSEFDFIFSVLSLHHCPDIEAVFRSIADAPKADGKAVIIDLLRHGYKDFREAMGDYHLGFSPTELEEAAGKCFGRVSYKLLRATCRCPRTRKKVGLFKLVLGAPVLAWR